MALTGNEILQVQGLDGKGYPSATTQTTTTGAIAALASVETTSPTNTPITTVGNGTITAAGIVNRLVTRTGPTSNFTDTTDTAANIIAALPSGAVVGDAFEFIYVNNTAFLATISAGTNVTVSNLTVVGSNSTARFVVTYATATTVTLYCVESDYNTFAGANPPTEITFFGSGTGTFPEEGNVYRTASNGVNPGGTGGDYVIAVYTLPANSFDVSGRGISLQANGSYAANGNTKRIKIFYNATTATVGSTVTGGTLIADSGAVTTNGAGWSLGAEVFKYGAAGSNTQTGIHVAAQNGNAVGTLQSPVALTATESSAIIVAVTGNATTTATDIALNLFAVNAMN